MLLFLALQCELLPSLDPHQAAVPARPGLEVRDVHGLGRIERKALPMVLVPMHDILLPVIEDLVPGPDLIALPPDAPASFGDLAQPELPLVTWPVPRLLALCPAAGQFFALLFAPVPAVYVYRIVELLQPAVVPALLFDIDPVGPVLGMEVPDAIGILYSSSSAGGGFACVFWMLRSSRTLLVTAP